MDAQLVVTLLPAEAAEAGGGWRFPWELGWRNSGEAASNLVAGDYPIEFCNPRGYLAYPQALTKVSVANGGTTWLTNQYYRTLNVSGTTNTGALTVNIIPARRRTPAGGS